MRRNFAQHRPLRKSWSGDEMIWSGKFLNLGLMFSLPMFPTFCFKSEKFVTPFGGPLQCWMMSV